jgi:hypothetical protein
MQQQQHKGDEDGPHELRDIASQQGDAESE